MPRGTLTLYVDTELIEVAKEYAKANYTSVSNLVRQYFLGLKRELERSGKNDKTDTGQAQS